MTDPDGTDETHVPDGGPNVDDLLDQLESLEQTVDSEEERAEVQQTMRLARRIPGTNAVSRRISRYTSRDVAESFVGSVVFSLPLLVEDGVYEIAEHMATTFVGGLPIFFLANVIFVTGLTAALLYYAEFRDVKLNPLFGFIPRRLVGVLTVAAVTAALLMTMWGRVEGWSDPWIAVCRISVIWAAAALGGALGDILPGETVRDGDGTTN